ASDVSVWRSDNSGAHWTLVSGFPYQQPDTEAFAAAGASDAQTTLFAAAGQSDTYQRLMSTDGGQTWQPLLTAGLPGAPDPALLNCPRTTLSDGAVLAPVLMAPGGHIALYSWMPGSQAWHQVGPSLTDDPIDFVVAPSANGHDTIWVVAASDKRDYTVLY